MTDRVWYTTQRLARRIVARVRTDPSAEPGGKTNRQIPTRRGIARFRLHSGIGTNSIHPRRPGLGEQPGGFEDEIGMEAPIFVASTLEGETRKEAA